MGNYIKGMLLQVKHKDDTRQAVIGNEVVITLTWVDQRCLVRLNP